MNKNRKKVKKNLLNPISMPPNKIVSPNKKILKNSREAMTRIQASNYCTTVRKDRIPLNPLVKIRRTS